MCLQYVSLWGRDCIYKANTILDWTVRHRGTAWWRQALEKDVVRAEEPARVSLKTLKRPKWQGLVIAWMKAVMGRMALIVTPSSPLLGD